jgi:hypothetical protein
MLARCCFAASLLRGLTASVPAGGAARHRDDPRLHRRPGDQLLRHRQRERLAPRPPAPRCLSIVSADTPVGRHAAQVYEGYDRVRSVDRKNLVKGGQFVRPRPRTVALWYISTWPATTAVPRAPVWLVAPVRPLRSVMSVRPVRPERPVWPLMPAWPVRPGAPRAAVAPTRQAPASMTAAALIVERAKRHKPPDTKRSTVVAHSRARGE